MKTTLAKLISAQTPIWVLALVAASLAFALPAPAAEKKKKVDAAEKVEVKKDSTETPAAAPSNDGERVNVENIKEKYWARGDESELGVVQNRLYSKSRKIEAGLYGGTIMTDPFLNVTALGGSLGFHFNEYLSLHLMGWKSYANDSSALTLFRAYSSGDANVNRPSSYLGLEFRGSLLYGKLSVVGKSIIYYDMHASFGLGSTSTYSGNYLTPSITIGQQIFLSKSVSFNFDYRLMAYREQILEQVVTAQLGAVKGTRNNFSNVFTLGFSFLFGGASAPNSGASTSATSSPSGGAK